MKKKTRRTAKAKTGTITPEALAAAAAGVALLDLRLVKAYASIGSEAEIRAPVQFRQKINVRSGQDQSDASTDRRFLVEIVFMGVHDESQSTFIEIAATYGLRYRFPSEEVNAEAIQKFGELNGLFHVWPFWRELVHSLFGRMGLSPIVVPLMRPTDVEFIQENSQEIAPLADK